MKCFKTHDERVKYQHLKILIPHIIIMISEKKNETKILERIYALTFVYDQWRRSV